MTGRVLLVSLLASAAMSAPLLASPASDAEKERVLLEGVVVGTEQPPGGRSLSIRATLRLGHVEHTAMVHTLDEWKASFKLVDRTEFDFRDSFKNNIAAYRLDRMLGLGMTPVTVLRRHKGQPASFMWWVDDVQMDEGEFLAKKVQPPNPGTWARQRYVTLIFDELIHNYDRNTGNLLIDNDWRVWMIDHTRAFKVFSELRHPQNLGRRCERDLLAALRSLDEAALRETMKDLLNPDQIQGLLGRRDIIVKHFDELLAEQPEVLVLFDLPSRIETDTH